jgi:BlaI family transcriptional regulator, penicillinase repressor
LIVPTKKPSKPTKGEFEILQALWKLGPATVKEIHEQVGRHGVYTTTLKILQIMTEKRFVERRTKGRAHIYKAKITEEKGTGDFVHELVERFFGGSPARLVIQVLGKRASAKDLAEIRDLVAKLSRK